MEILFTPSLNIIEPHLVGDHLQEATESLYLASQVEDLITEVDDNAKTRDDIPADIRVTLERYSQVTQFLLDMVLMVQLDESEVGHG